jgi:hypothetical protein
LYSLNKEHKNKKMKKPKRGSSVPEELTDDIFVDCTLQSNPSGRFLRAEKIENDLKKFGKWNQKPISEFVRRRREAKRRAKLEEKDSLFKWGGI